MQIHEIEVVNGVSFNILIDYKTYEKYNSESKWMPSFGVMKKNKNRNSELKIINLKSEHVNQIIEGFKKV